MQRHQRDITNILETVHYILEELKRKSTKKFQETDSFIELSRKSCGNYNKKNELMIAIAALKIENQNLKNELYNKNIIISNLSGKRNAFQVNKHSVKSVQIRSFFWSVLSRVRTEYEDLRSKRCVKTVQIRSFFWSLFSHIQSVFGHFPTTIF